MNQLLRSSHLAGVVLSLAIAPGLLGCPHDEPTPPSQDTGASEPDCNQALQDALDEGQCQPPGSLSVNFNLGSIEYLYVDDPYFEAVGSLGVFGPGVGAGAGGGIAGSADSIARVLESNGTCEILCVYDIISCNEQDPVCIGFSGSSCLYCNDGSVTIQQCQDFLNGCSPGGGMGDESDGTGATETTETTGVTGTTGAGDTAASSSS